MAFYKLLRVMLNPQPWLPHLNHKIQISWCSLRLL
jgi:hypothetical protein